MDSRPVTTTAASTVASAVSPNASVPVTDTTFITPIFNKINDIYLKKTYLERYGGSVIFAIFAIIIVAFYFIYLNIKNDKEIVKKDWPINKCNPKYMPFAGMIIEPKDMSHMEYTIKNFSECSEIILKDIIQIALAPVEAASILISASVSILTGVSNSLMQALSFFRNVSFKNQVNDTYRRQTSTSSLLTKLTVNIRSTLAKGEGILATILYIFFTAYKAGASVFHVIMWGEAVILFIMYGVLIFVWTMIAIKLWLFPPAAFVWVWVAVGLTVIYIAFMIMILVLIIFVRQVIDKSDDAGIPSASDKSSPDLNSV
jgi:hypothetical protein